MYIKLRRNHANNHLPFSDFPYDQYALRGGRQRDKHRHFSYVIARDATGIGHIQNRTTGGDSSRRRASFLYTSHLRGIKIHILNCGRCLKKFGGVCQGTAANRRDSNSGQYYFTVSIKLPSHRLESNNDNPIAHHEHNPLL